MNMYLNEIPVGSIVCLTSVHMNSVSTTYTKTINVETTGKIPTVVIPKIEWLTPKRMIDPISISYFDEEQKHYYRWHGVEVIDMRSYFILLSKHKGQLMERRHSTRVPIGVPCSVTGKSVSITGAVLHNLSLEGFNITLSDQVPEVHDELTISFTDDDYENVINGIVIHTEPDQDDIMHCGGRITETMHPINSYLDRKIEEYFENKVKEVRARKDE